MKEYLPIAQIVVSSILIILILLQQRGSALGSLFGGESGFYTTRRGVQKKLFWFTCFLAVVFLVLATLNLLV